jgi:uncharacterized membrane protein
MFALLQISTGYQIMGMLHIISAIAAFGPLFVYPSLKRAGETSAIASMHMRLVFPALVVLWVLGMGLAGMSQDAYKVADLWMSLSIGVWAILMVVSWFLIRPAINDTSERSKSMLAAGIGSTHLLLVVGLYLMIFKPGA